MPSPFPGMDPYLESSEWESFHSAFVIDIADALSDAVPDRYVVRAEKRVYVDHGDDELAIVADAALLHETSTRTVEQSTSPRGSTATANEVDLAMPEEHHETFIEIRSVENREVVTLVELLSPANKRPGEGRREYRRKLDHVLQTATHFVEIDLLRGGRRCSTHASPSGYRVLVSRARQRPRAEAVTWSLPDPLPTVSIPLRAGDDDVPVDLQSVFSKRYDRGHYGRTLPYDEPLVPSASEAEAAWIGEKLRAWRESRVG